MNRLNFSLLVALLSISSLFAAVGIATCGSITPVHDEQVVMETAHYTIVYASRNCNQVYDEILHRLASTLEEDYAVVSRILRLNPSVKITVKLYADVQGLHDALGWPDAPDHIMAAGRILDTGPQIDIIDPGYISARGLDFFEVLGHEVTHCLSGLLFPGRVPAWLSEGVAEYLYMILSNRTCDVAAIRNDVQRNRVPELDQLSTVDALWEHHGYVYPCTVIDFIIKKHGHSALNAFIRAPLDYRGAFGVSKVAFQQRWKRHLKEELVL